MVKLGVLRKVNSQLSFSTKGSYSQDIIVVKMYVNNRCYRVFASGITRFRVKLTKLRARAPPQNSQLLHQQYMLSLQPCAYFHSLHLQL